MASAQFREALAFERHAAASRGVLGEQDRAEKGKALHQILDVISERLSPA